MSFLPGLVLPSSTSVSGLYSTTSSATSSPATSPPTSPTSAKPPKRYPSLTKTIAYTTQSNTTANANLDDFEDFLQLERNSKINKDAQPPAQSNKTLAPAKQRSVNGYVSRVGFDTLNCRDTLEYAFTLQAKTEHWHRTAKSRTFLVGTDLNDYSAHALRWVMENMVEDGDEVVALRVVPMELRDTLANRGIPSFHGQEAAARTEAAKIMNTIRENNMSKQISIVVECMVGNVRDTIQHMVQLYQPNMLVVGTRGRSSVKGFLLGSVSRYCLHHSTVPVTVVRPERKLTKSKTKAKGIFRRRSSVPENNGYQPQSPPSSFGQHLQPNQQTLVPSSSHSSLDMAMNLNISKPSTAASSINSGLSSSTMIPVMPSAAIAAGEVQMALNQLAPKGVVTTAMLPIPQPAKSRHPVSAPSSPPSSPPEVHHKIKKTLTTDGSGTASVPKSTIRGFKRSTSNSFLSASSFMSLGGGNRDKDKEKDEKKEEKKEGLGAFMKSRKRSSQGA